MKPVLLVIHLLISFCLIGQTRKTIYCFPGQGSDKRIFDSIRFDTSYNVKFIEYGTPESGMKMESFAASLASQIDTTHGFILLGVSLGGMICIELNELLHPEKTIIISSAKNRKELPFRYKLQRIFPIYKILGGRSLLLGAKLLQPIVEPDRNKNKSTFKSMLAAKKPLYMKRTIGLIVNWDRKTNSKEVYHIHGKKDHTIPFRNITSPYKSIDKGSHMITLTRANEISKILNQILKE